MSSDTASYLYHSRAVDNLGMVSFILALTEAVKVRTCTMHVQSLAYNAHVQLLQSFSAIGKDCRGIFLHFNSVTCGLKPILAAEHFSFLIIDSITLAKMN